IATSHFFFFFFSSRRRHTRWPRDWSSDVCSSDLNRNIAPRFQSAEQFGDLAYPSDQITKLLRALETGSDVAIACRVLPESRYIRSEERRVGKECRAHRTEEK